MAPVFLFRLMRYVIVLTLFLSAGCDSEVLQDSKPDSGERIQFIMDGLDDAPDSSDPFELRAAEFKGSVLNITASYSGGCNEHGFKLYSSDQIMLSYPPVIGMVIVHNAHNDACEAYITETFGVDLSALVARFNSPFSIDLIMAGSNENLRIEYSGS